MSLKIIHFRRAALNVVRILPRDLLPSLIFYELIGINRVTVTRFHSIVNRRREIISSRSIPDTSAFDMLSLTWISPSAENARTPGWHARVETSQIIHESNTPSLVDLRQPPFLSRPRYPFPFYHSPPFISQILCPAATVLVSAGKFSRLRVASLHPGVPSPESFRRPLPRASYSFRRESIVYSSQLDDIRRAKLHFAAILHLLYDLAAAILLVQVNVALRTVAVLVVVLLLLQILENLAPVESPAANSAADRQLLFLLLTDFILANGSPWLFVSFW